MSRREQPPEFFIDRSLGKKHVAEALRACGLVVHTMASIYGEAKAQRPYIYGVYAQRIKRLWPR